MKKLIKFLCVFIPNKKLRHKIRSKYDDYILKKELYFIEYGEGKNQLRVIEKEFPKVLSLDQTLDEVINNKKSICRFGDGEFNLLYENKKSKNIFQKRDEKLKNRLFEIIRSNNKDILICISPFKTKKNIINKELEKVYPKFMERYWLNNWIFLKKIILSNKVYGNALVSRVDVFHEINLEKIKKVWENREIVFVYSSKGRFEKDERLFNNIQSFEEILIPPLDAFSEYDLILKKCLKKSKTKLFLIAAGPTATVLAYDLAKEGYQALDIGHLPNCYQEYLGEIASPEFLPKEK